MNNINELINGYRAGKTLRELKQQATGLLQGLAHESIRQYLLKALGSEEYKAIKEKGHKERMQQRKFTKELKLEIKLESRRFICRVCLKESTRATRNAIGQTKTCSPECAKLWVVCRLHLDPIENHKHKIKMAQYFLQRLDAPTSKRIWAERFLAGKAAQRKLPIRSQVIQKALNRVMELRQVR